MLICCCTYARATGKCNSAIIDAQTFSSKDNITYSGHIFLYGESHGNKTIIEKEFDIWNEYYKKGMRHLFVELPYYTGEFLNIWMKASDDSILDDIYKDLEGTAAHNQYSLEFYRKIKRKCPDTIFHGTDVGHQYDSTGARYLKYLEEKKVSETSEYEIVKENIAQGIEFYRGRKDIYRENMMVKNFEREIKLLNGQDIMGIYGAAHTGLNNKDNTGSIPCMATQLRAVYGSAIESVDLNSFAKNIDPIRTDKILVAGKEYTAYYYGRESLIGFRNYVYRDFWKIENGYNDFKDLQKSGDVLPYNNYPMIIENSEVFVIDYKLSDNRVERKYYCANGNYWNNQLVTEEVLIK
jgi:hypothetical protein